jgi:hypothetical protein
MMRPEWKSMEMVSLKLAAAASAAATCLDRHWQRLAGWHRLDERLW